MTIEQLKTLKQIVKKDMTIDPKDPHIMEVLCDSTLHHSKLYHRYVDLFTVESRKLKKLKADKVKKYGELYHHYKFEGDFKLDTKGEIDAYIGANKEYYDLILKFNDQEIVCQFLDKTLDNINNMKWNVKNYLEYKKFLSGE